MAWLISKMSKKQEYIFRIQEGSRIDCFYIEATLYTKDHVSEDNFDQTYYNK